ncbi:MAG: hypothetical protein F4Y39_13415 [Gemmatimonadetes bacterium]|nr:hypothetical protein [Gemmatimonadota bacterium]MYK54278.1 hypothetical protein [Gemmatimonadota bacterium]
MTRGRLPVLLIGLLLLSGCGGERDPVVEMQKSLASAPAYMIVLDDIREEGTLFTTYYHRYLITQGEKKVQSDWIEVSESIYRKYEPFLGMALVAKSEQDGVNNTPHPPGYHYVGNPSYGRWTDRGGTSFWEFYGQYALMSHMLGWGGGFGMSRYDYDDYRSYRRDQRPYYGRNREYGTQGSVTQKQKPSTFQRRQANIAQQRQSFTQKVQSRASQSRSGFGSSRSTSRSRSGFGSRSFGGFGK